ncbi:PDZ domain-containing protein [Luteolibacter ambystomatis]|uniref:PDZ domain-containing protein n=1 Tax=Luteolibacter ambystomatis TaxID=2824561 RepID=A0A975G679_9BACT|nr:trypsin-like peptidase domain-containing protein [Luteolibacter ambystomatis]QUE49552.1 PDZ domain-containing protein [Luteolibacter ambystomatis]
MMKTRAFFAAVAAGLLAWSPAALRAAEPVKTVADLKHIEKEVADVASKVMPATVALVSEQTGSSGSGVITSADGLILTAAHVVQGVDDMLVVFPNGRQINGRVLGANYSKDIAMVKIDGKGPWPFVERGNSKTLMAGDWLVAMGHSAGFDPNRTPPVRFGRVVSKGPGNFFTSDCTLIGGDSGGPIFDLQGRIVGINSSIGESRRNNNHAGVDGFREDWDRLMAGDNWGELSMNPFANPEAPVLGIGMGRDSSKGLGVPVEKVTPRSPAAAAGVRVGDLLVGIDSGKVGSGRDLQLALAKKQPGDKIRLALMRDQTKLDLEVTLVKRDALYDPRSLRGIGIDPELFEKKEVPLLSAEENEAIASQYADLCAVGESVAARVSASTVQVYAGKNQVAYGTVVGNGTQVLTKWSEIARKGAAIQVLDSKGTTHSAKITGVHEDEDIAVLSIDGPVLTPVKWSDRGSPALGSFVVASRRDAKLGGLGVVAVLSRSLRESDQAFLGVNGDMTYSGPGVKVGSVEEKTGAETAGIKEGDVILKIGDRAISGLMELRNSLLGKNPGDKVAMKISRGGKTIDVEVLLGNRPRLPQFTNLRLRQMEQMGGAISRVRDMFPAVVQSDLQLKPQQCGGPVVDLDGNVIGISIAQADRTRSFFIPADEVVAMLKKPTVDSAVARVGNPPAELPNQMARRGDDQAPRMQRAPDRESIGRARRNVRDMERLIERLHEEMDAVEPAR